MYKLLEDCAALVRRSIEGLDNFVMEGCRAFRDLESVVHKLGLNNAESKSVLENLQNAKRYLKSELKVCTLSFLIVEYELYIYSPRKTLKIIEIFLKILFMSCMFHFHETSL